MAKASAPGRTKTRLVPPLTFDEAARLNTVFLQDIAANLLAAAQKVSCEIRMLRQCCAWFLHYGLFFAPCYQILRSATITACWAR